MALSVNSNISSLNAQRNLSKASNSLSKTLERLSSGQRINRAGDDAAGLAISETMRSQIRGLNQAVRNSNDGISLVGTAEGALDESTAILQRIRELSVQAASDTYTASNRNSLQEEIDQQIAELTRIGNTTEFNGAKILDGTYDAKKLHVGANANQTIEVSISDVRATALGGKAVSTGTTVTASLASGDLTINGTVIGATDGSAQAIAAAIGNAVSNVSAAITGPLKGGSAAVAAMSSLGGNAGKTLSINGVAITAAGASVAANGANLKVAINAQTSLTGVSASISANRLVLRNASGGNIVYSAGASIAKSTSVASGTYRGSITLTGIGDLTIAGTDPTKAGLTAGTTEANVSLGSAADVDVTTISGANEAISMMDAAIGQVNSIRASLGALTNRLESTISNLKVTAENLSASDSRVRDADFAFETANLTKYQILQQAGTSILAQANMTPQAALSLLQ